MALNKKDSLKLIFIGVFMVVYGIGYEFFYGDSLEYLIEILTFQRVTNISINIVTGIAFITCGIWQYSKIQ